MKPLRFYKTKTDAVIAVLGKCGSTAISRALARDVFPEHGEETKKRSRENGGMTLGEVIGLVKELQEEREVQVANVDRSPPHATTEELHGKRILVPVRDPLERFLSACAQEQLDPAFVLNDLERGGHLTEDFHFRPAADYTRLPGAVPFRFPEDLEWMCAEVGIHSLGQDNKHNPDRSLKPILSDEQIARVEAYYDQDLTTREQLMGANYEWCHEADAIYRMFDTKSNAVVAAIGKCGSTAVGQALLEDVWPSAKERNRQPDSKPRKVAPGEPQVIIAALDNLPPQVQPWDPEFAGKDVIVPVRDPVERFVSACVQESIDPETALRDLEAGGELLTNYHFQPAAVYAVFDRAKLYAFPEAIDSMCERIGVEPFGQLNASSGKKPELTRAQEVRVKAVYREDIEARQRAMENYHKTL